MNSIKLNLARREQRKLTIQRNEYNVETHVDASICAALESVIKDTGNNPHETVEFLDKLISDIKKVKVLML